MKNKLLCEVLNMCYFISNESEADVFFDYAPHCDTYSVCLHRDGWAMDYNGVYLECVTEITCKNLRRTIAKLNAIAIELGVA